MKKKRSVYTFGQVLSGTLPMITPGFAVVIDENGVIVEQTDEDFDRQFCEEMGIPYSSENSSLY